MREQGAVVRAEVGQEQRALRVVARPLVSVEVAGVMEPSMKSLTVWHLLEKMVTSGQWRDSGGSGDQWAPAGGQEAGDCRLAEALAR